MFDVAGATVTVATGTGAGALTVIAAAADCPSLETVIETFPAATAVTSPDVETLATAVFAELQPITRPVSTLLLASRVTADSCTVAPVRRLALVGDTDTDATGIGAGALTVIAEVAVCPSLETVIETFPAATAVTSPDVETLAIAVFAELQPITRPVSTLLLASRVTADSCTVAPISRVALAGDIDTDATGIGAGALTFRAEEPVIPPLDAEIIAVPAATVVMSPV
jgi:hypothetical protein